MSALAHQQQVLLDALFSWPAGNAIKTVAACGHDPGARGLKAYQTNGHMLAERALASAYPVVAQLLGDESFGELARAFWHAYPPRGGDIGGWGEALADFLRSSVQLRQEPYLPDVAQVEWALHRCSTAPDRASDIPTLGLLTCGDAAQVGLRLAPGCSVLRSAWPVCSILLAHMVGEPTLQAAGAQMRAGVAQDALVWRAGLRPLVRQALVGEVECLRVLLGGGSLAQALGESASLDFGQWLPMAVKTGLVLGAHAL